MEGPDLPEVECSSQLARILQSADFEATARGHKFLSYVVDEELSGRGDRIKAYSIAVEVFGRDASFDPQTDPIVRIEAGHLRRSLERYYLTSGQSDPILITIPKGGYVPTFTPRSDGPDDAVSTAATTSDTTVGTAAPASSWHQGTVADCRAFGAGWSDWRCCMAPDDSWRRPDKAGNSKAAR